MPRSPSPDDFFRRLNEMQRRIEALERQSRAHIETKTICVMGELGEDFIPRALLCVNPEDGAPETKRIIATWCELLSGSMTIAFDINGEEIAYHEVTTSPSFVDVEGFYGSEYFLPVGESWVRTTVLSGTGVNLSAGFVIVTSR